MVFKRSIVILKKFVSTVTENPGLNLTTENYGKDRVYAGLTRPLSAWYQNAFSLSGNDQGRCIRFNEVCNSITPLISVNSELNHQAVGFSSRSVKHPCVNSTCFSGLHAKKFSDISQPISALIVSRNFSTLIPRHNRTVSLQRLPHEFSVVCVSGCRMKHSLPKVPPTRMMSVYDIERAITDEEAAKEFVYALKAGERKFLYEELARFHGDTSILNNTANEFPTRQQLRIVMLHQMFPFIGFGFLDNFLMIVAGEYIDMMLGVTLGISTMAAAAIGNWISDVCGLGSAHYVESIVSRFGIRHPHLSPAQVDMKSTKWASNLGKVIGVTIGCFLGMIPLLFFRKKKTKGEKENKDEKAAETSKPPATA